MTLAPFELYTTTEEDAFSEGFMSGLEWPKHWNHVPGGPWVARPWGNINYSFARDIEHVRKWNAYAEQTRLNNLAYMRGWRGAMKQRKEKWAKRLATKDLYEKLAA